MWNLYCVWKNEMIWVLFFFYVSIYHCCHWMFLLFLPLSFIFVFCSKMHLLLDLAFFSIELTSLLWYNGLVFLFLYSLLFFAAIWSQLIPSCSQWKLYLYFLFFCPCLYSCVIHVNAHPSEKNNFIPKQFQKFEF